MARVPLVCGNWKLHKTIAESTALANDVKNAVAIVRDVEVAVAPVYTALHAVGKKLEGSAVALCAQDCFWEDHGAYTGEVSVALLKDVGCTYIIVGHSERRQHFGELDASVARKARTILQHGIAPIVCVGETLAERDASDTFARVGAQLEGSLTGIAAEDGPRVVVAYEPVWAIGTGRTATPAQAEEVHVFIRVRLAERWGAQVADRVRIQYGGSVKPENAKQLLEQPNIDGALVGGASLKADDFLKIVKYRQG